MGVELFQRHYRGGTLLGGACKLFDFAEHFSRGDGFYGQTHRTAGRARKRKRLGRDNRQTGFAELVGTLGQDRVFDDKGPTDGAFVEPPLLG